MPLKERTRRKWTKLKQWWTLHSVQLKRWHVTLPIVRNIYQVKKLEEQKAAVAQAQEAAAEAKKQEQEAKAAEAEAKTQAA